MDKPDVVEYILKNNVVICTKEDIYDLGEVQARTSIIWDAQSGGVRLTYSTNDHKIVSQEVITDDYSKASNSTLEVDYNLLETMLDMEGYSPPDGKEIYTILKEVPKEAELVDYTMVIIPKVMYDKLKSDND